LRCPIITSIPLFIFNQTKQIYNTQNGESRGKKSILHIGTNQIKGNDYISTINSSAQLSYNCIFICMLYWKTNDIYHRRRQFVKYLICIKLLWAVNKHWLIYHRKLFLIDICRIYPSDTFSFNGFKLCIRRKQGLIFQSM